VYSLWNQRMLAIEAKTLDPGFRRDDELGANSF
jgi:hypothetical protein